MSESVSLLQERYYGRLTEVVFDALAVNPNVSIATVTSRNGRLASHSTEVWLDVSVDEGLTVVRFFSGEGRVHSENIAANESVSGSISKPQKLSQPCEGAAFEGNACVIPESGYRDYITGDWIERGLFTEKEVEGYLHPDAKKLSSGVPPHQVYEAVIHEWSMMDSVSQDADPSLPRLVVWGGYNCLLPQDGSVHATRSPHLHLETPEVNLARRIVHSAIAQG